MVILIIELKRRGLYDDRHTEYDEYHTLCQVHARGESEMGSEAAEKRAQILNEAIRLFREHGFAGVSVGEIMKSSGLTHGPFYYHFSSKEALMAECVEHAMRRGTFELLEPIVTTSERKAKFVRSYLNATHRDSPGKGCVIAALASEIRQEPTVRGPFTSQVKAYVERLASRFPWSSKRTARGDSIRMLSSIVGALILSRAVDDEAFSNEILREVRQGLL